MDKISYRVHCLFEDSHLKIRPSDDHIGWLRNNGFCIEETGFFDTFDVIFTDVKNEQEKEEERKKLDMFLLAISIRNCMGFIAFELSEDSKDCVWCPIPPHLEFFTNFTNLCKTPDFLETVQKIRMFYAQVSAHPKIIYGVSLLEDFFDTTPEHILEKKELKEVITKISELSFNDKKRLKISNVLKDSNFMAIKTRNERMAEKISKITQIEKSVIKEKIKIIYEARNKSAHDVRLSAEAEKGLKEIHCILEIYLIKKFGFVRLTGQLLNFDKKVII